MRPSNSTCMHLYENLCPHKAFYTIVHSSFINNNPKWRQPKWLLTDEYINNLWYILQKIVITLKSNNLQEQEQISKSEWRTEAKHEKQTVSAHLHGNPVTEISRPLWLGARVTTTQKLKKCFSDGKVPAPDCSGGHCWTDSPPLASHTPACLVECAKSARPRPVALEPGLQLVTSKDEVMSCPGQRAGLLTALYEGNGSLSSAFFSCNTKPLREHPSWPHCHPWWTWEEGEPQQIYWFLMWFARPGFCQHPVAAATGWAFSSLPKSQVKQLYGSKFIKLHA